MTATNGTTAIARVIRHPRYSLLLIGLWVFAFWLFVYITNLNLFYYIWFSSGWFFSEQLSFMISSFTSIVTSLSNLVVFSIFIFSFFAALNVTMLIHLLKNRHGMKMNHVGGAGSIAAIVVSHFITCGGSLLAPAITLIAGSGAFLSAARINTATTISVLINIIAIVLIVRSTLKIAAHTALLHQRN